MALNARSYLLCMCAYDIVVSCWKSVFYSSSSIQIDKGEWIQVSVTTKIVEWNSSMFDEFQDSLTLVEYTMRMVGL